MKHMARQNRKIWDSLPKKDWSERQAAIRELIACPEQDIFGELEAGIRNHDDADTRNAAMEVYKALGTRGFDSLEKLLRDPDQEVRLFAVNILCEIADRDASPLLEKAIQDPDVNVRVAAAEAMGKTGEGSAVPVLAGVLDDQPWVAMAAVNALGEIGGEDALTVLHDCLDLQDCQEMAINALGTAGDMSSINKLAACLNYDHLSAPVLNAIVNISEREGSAPGPEYLVRHIMKLFDMLETTDDETRKSAIMAISWLTESAVEQSLQWIAEFPEDGRIKAASALGAYNFPQSQQILQSLLLDPSEEVRAAATISLRKLGMDL